MCEREFLHCCIPARDLEKGLNSDPITTGPVHVLLIPCNVIYIDYTFLGICLVESQTYLLVYFRFPGLGLMGFSL